MLKHLIALGLLATLCGCTIRVTTVNSNPLLSPVKQINQAPIDEAHKFLAERTRFDAFVAVSSQNQVTRWGEADLPINTHSVRKSVMGLLVGMAIDKGLMDIDATLGALGVDEPATPLTVSEKTATIRHLLQSRSGIYLEAAGETAAMKEARPKRGAHVPGAFFYYNNWDFNVLGTIFEQQTKMSIGVALNEWLAKPLKMRSFVPEHVIYVDASGSRYRQFVIFMSAEDLARLGVLFIQDGQWEGRQIVSAKWVSDSLTSYSKVSDHRVFDGYGYLWWIASKENTAWADGWRGQYMIVDRARKLVVVSRNDTGRNLITTTWARAFGKDGFRDHHQRLHRLMIDAVSN